MSLLDLINLAVKDYPKASVDVSITEYTFPGTVLNVDEIFKFKVKIENKGCLNMTGVSAKVLGSSYAEVNLTGTPPFSSSVTIIPVPTTIGPGASVTTGWVFGKATRVTPGSPPSVQTIVSARLEAWDASLDSMLNSSSMSGPEEGKLDQSVNPN
jgi:hypothetical protein